MVIKIANYILTERVRKLLISRGYKVICKICEEKLKVGQCIESKPNKYRNRKFYHCHCYQDSFIDLPDNDEGDGEDDKS